MKQSGKMIGVCVSQLHDMEYSRLVQNISRRAEQSGYRVLIFGCFAKMDLLSAHAKGQMSVFDQIPMKELSALVLLGQTILNRPLLEKLRDEALETGTAVITIDYEMEKCFNIRLDYRSSFKRLVRHVIEGHHRLNPFFMAGFKQNQFSDERLEVYEEVLEENGMPVIGEHIAYGDFWEAPARQVCEKWMENQDDLPDAIICANDTMALAVLGVLEDHHMRVPEDVIVTGYDGIEVVKYCSPLLTTVRIDYDEIVTQLLQIVDGIEKGTPADTRYVQVPSHILRGESCGCAPVQLRSTNQHILHFYNRLASERQHINEMFSGMTKLSEGHSVMNVLGHCQNLIHEITEGNFYLFFNKTFCRHTDIALSKEFQQEDMLLAATQADGEYRVVMEWMGEGHSDIWETLWNGTADQYLFLPLHWQDEVFGFMALQFMEEGVNYEHLNDFTMTLAQILGTVRNQSQLYEMYISDPLTELYNRRGFYGELSSRMKEFPEGKCMMFLAAVDLDHLKKINDGYGHSEGDVAIKAIADALVDAVEEKGICARFGGDEYFAVCLWALDAVPESYEEEFDNRLQAWMDQWNQSFQKGYTLGASVGTVMRPVSQVDEVDELMKIADSHMYDCKEMHHNRVRESRRKV